MTRSGRRARGFDRVGGGRLTAVGSVLLMAILIGLANPPASADRQIMVLVWSAMVVVLVLGVVWPLVAVRRIRLSASTVSDATAGDRVPIDVTLTGGRGACEIRSLDPTSAWHGVSATRSGSLEHLADRRGVFGFIRLELRVTAPVGVFAAHRVLVVPLPRPIEVAPRPLKVAWQPAPAPLEGGIDPVALAALGGDMVRSVRPYAAGDPAHLVHWPSTARTGSLVVRELEPPSPVGQAIVVDLRDLGPDRERAASYALGAAIAVLGAGGELLLCTAEESGSVVTRVRTRLEAGRRLARAVAGQPGTPPEGWPIVEIGR